MRPVESALAVRDALRAAGMIREDSGTEARSDAREADRSTRTRILIAAISLFADRGFHACTMRDLAAAVGVKAPAIYNHFESKEQILAEAAREALARYFTHVIGPVEDEPAEACLHGIVLRWVEFHIAEHEMAAANGVLLDTGTLRQILAPEDWDPLHSALLDYIRVLRTLVRALSDGSVDERVLVRGLTAICDRVGIWYEPGGELGAEEVAEQTWRACRRMIVG